MPAQVRTTTHGAVTSPPVYSLADGARQCACACMRHAARGMLRRCSSLRSLGTNLTHVTTHACRLVCCLFEGAGEDGRKHDMFEAHASMYLTDERAKLVFFVRHAEGNPMCIEGKNA